MLINAYRPGSSQHDELDDSSLLEGERIDPIPKKSRKKLRPLAENDFSAFSYGAQATGLLTFACKISNFSPGV